jgi:Ca2+-binding RTX toxin-like protein
VFAFSAALARNIDRVNDFNAADDTFQLDDSVFTALAAGGLDASAFQLGASSVAAGAGVRIIFNTARGGLFYDADGAGGGAAVQFATVVLAGLVGPITAADFVVV